MLMMSCYLRCFCFSINMYFSQLSFPLSPDPCVQIRYQCNFKWDQISHLFGSESEISKPVFFLVKITFRMCLPQIWGQIFSIEQNTVFAHFKFLKILGGINPDERNWQCRVVFVCISLNEYFHHNTVYTTVHIQWVLKHRNTSRAHVLSPQGKFFSSNWNRFWSSLGCIPTVHTCLWVKNMNDG